MTPATVQSVVDRLAERFPPERAESWDRVGLLAGDSTRRVTGIFVTLDATRETVSQTVAAGANVLVSHHPIALDPPPVVRAGGGAAGVLFAALDSGVALACAHTNLDRDGEAQALLPRMLGLTPVRPLESGIQETSLVTVYAPAEAADAIAQAMAAAGAGRIGDYAECRFACSGEGSYTAPADGNPTIGAPGERTTVAETRLEMVCPAAAVNAVVDAARAAHPYEEPLITVTETSIARNRAAFGMLSRVEEPLTAAELARRAAAALGVTPRVWGPADRQISTIATATGSAGSLLRAAHASGADAMVAGELRYHDALIASQDGLVLIEVGHDASEWPLVSVLAQAVRETSGLDAPVIEDDPKTHWWTP